MIKKLYYRCLGNYCQQASHCRRHTQPEKGQIIPLAAFDIRDKADGQCDGYVPRIMEPIRVESEEMCRLTYRSRYKSMLAAAPKPAEPTIKESLTVAEPDCECGAVASEYCPACGDEPVAQKPVTVEALREVETAWLADAISASIANIGYPVGCGVAPNRESLTHCAGKLFDRFAALASAISQPDQGATLDLIAANEAADKLNALCCEQQERIAELEATIEAQRTLYRNASKIANENDELMRQRDGLVGALEEAREEVVGWAAYASEYFQQKHNLKGYVEKLDATLASVKGNAEGVRPERR